MNNQSENLQDSQLRYYTLAKQQVGDLLRSGLQFFQKNNNELSEQQCRDLLVKLAEDRFNLVVVGQFKRGKSSLMNAIIGRNLLPTGLLPLTSAITTLCFGPKEKVFVKRTGWVFEQEINLSELPEYVTEQGNPGNIKGVVEARIELPIPFLRRGLYFVDTPGIGSTSSENTATTYSFLPQSDAVIFVTSVEAPLSEPEEAFLRDVKQYAKQLFVVINKIDLLTDQEAESVFDYIKSGVSRILGSSDIHIYPLSARLALDAKLNYGSSRNDHNGLDTLEADLERFLAEEKSQLFLISIMDQFLRVISEASSANSENGNFSEEEKDHLLSLQSSAKNLRDSILSNSQTFPEPYKEMTQSSGVVKSPVISPVTEQPIVFNSKICPICAGLNQASFDFFAKYQSDLMQDAEVRKAFVESKGFCKVHTWQFEKMSSPQGISEGYVTWVEKIASELYQTSLLPSAQQENQIAELLSDSDNCPACKSLRSYEAILLDQFIDFISSQKGQEYYKRSLGLCLPHLYKTFTLNPTGQIRNFLLIEQARHFEELSEDMHSYTLKREAIRLGLANENEDNAWMYALIQIVGARNVHN